MLKIILVIINESDLSMKLHHIVKIYDKFNKKYIKNNNEKCEDKKSKRSNSEIHYLNYKINNYEDNNYQAIKK